MSPREFTVWWMSMKKVRLDRQAEARLEIGAPEPPQKGRWFFHVPQCPDRHPEDGRKCRLKADHPAHINNSHAGWRKIGKAKSWAVWSGVPFTRNHYGFTRNWRKKNESGQVRFVV